MPVLGSVTEPDGGVVVPPLFPLSPAFPAGGVVVVPPLFPASTFPPLSVPPPFPVFPPVFPDGGFVFPLFPPFPALWATQGRRIIPLQRRASSA